MRLTFTKLSGKYDALTVTRAEGSTEQIRCPKQGMIPHEMVHYAVEQVLAQTGFLGMVGLGQTPSARMAPTDGSEAMERLVEVLQAEVWSGQQAPVDIIALYEQSCAVRGHGPVRIDEATVRALRDEIARLTALWGAVPLMGQLTLLMG